MPLWLLGLLVVGGIGGLVALMHALGLSRGLTFADEAEALAHWQRNTGAAARRALLGPDGRAALIDGGAGVVWTMGADSTARSLDGARIRTGETGLVIRFPDPGAPVLRLPPETARAWAPMLAPILEKRA